MLRLMPENENVKLFWSQKYNIFYKSTISREHLDKPKKSIQFNIMRTSLDDILFIYVTSVVLNKYSVCG